MVFDVAPRGDDPGQPGVLLTVEPAVDEAQELAVARAIAREALAPGEPAALRSPWWLAGLERAVDRLA